MAREITQAEIKALFHYDHETGKFTRIKYMREVGKVSPTGYISISVFRENRLGHRLAWLYFYGYTPKIIDHINGDRADNRISNLRECTKAQNIANRHQYNANKTGYRGVWKYRGKWVARIMFNRKLISVGITYETALEASAAYEAKAIQLRGEFYSPPITKA